MHIPIEDRIKEAESVIERLEKWPLAFGTAWADSELKYYRALLQELREE